MPSPDARSQRNAPADPDWAHHASDLQRFGDQIQQRLGERSRLLSLRALCDEWSDAVAATATLCGVEVFLELDVGDVDLEQPLLLHLRRLLLSLLRNAVRYGIESPAERRFLGKHRRGTIQLRMRRVGSVLEVLVEDDGRGWQDALAAASARRGGAAAAADCATAIPFEQLAFEPALGISSRGPSQAQADLGALSAQVTAYPGAPDTGGSLRLEMPIACGRPDRGPATSRGLGRGAPAEASRAEPPVLVVDDSIAFTLVTSEILERAGYRLRVAGDASEALRMLGEAEFAAVVTDLRMPRMSGFDLLREIRERPGPRLPVVFVTSDDEPDHAEIAEDLEADGYVLKGDPDYAKNLLLALERALS